MVYLSRRVIFVYVNNFLPLIGVLGPHSPMTTPMSRLYSGNRKQKKHQEHGYCCMDNTYSHIRFRRNEFRISLTAVIGRLIVN